MKHFILYNQIKDKSIDSLLKRIGRNEKKVICDLKFIDLIYGKQSMNGVYVIFDPSDKPAYVGKTGSRAILERMAAHYDLRQNAFMNSFLCALAGFKKSRSGHQATDKEIKQAYEESLKYKMLFIEIPDKAIINRLERIISKELNPPLNSIKGKNEYDLNTKIKNI
ncbi:MAG: hypothetical protein J0L87_12880 [Bacteroidetes bacterium]|nr:hypothetical protein [Bacteroidota bacterium]